MPPTFPDAPRVELKQPPLELVVCQVRFPLVLGLMNHQPPEPFHREVRTLYPVAKRAPSGPSVAGHGERASQPFFWVFTDKDDIWTVSLGVDSLALETRRYPSFEQFVERFLALADVARRVYAIELREQIGLRYQDRLCKSIQPFLPGDWPRLIRPQLLPLRDFCGLNDPQMSHTETRFFFAGNRMLTVRSAFFDRGYPGFEEDTLFLDFDCYTEKRRDWDGMKADLLEFKRITYNAFRWATAGFGDCFEVSKQEPASERGESV